MPPCAPTFRRAMNGRNRLRCRPPSYSLGGGARGGGAGCWVPVPLRCRPPSYSLGRGGREGEASAPAPLPVLATNAPICPPTADRNAAPTLPAHLSGARLLVATNTSPESHSRPNRRCRIMASATSVTNSSSRASTWWGLGGGGHQGLAGVKRRASVQREGSQGADMTGVIKGEDLPKFVV